jgi:hypothetical protein
MDDALLMRDGQRVGEGDPDFEQPADGQTVFRDDAVERLALDELHGQEVDAVRLLDREDRDDLRVVEGRDRPRLPLEAFESLGTRRHLRRQHLEGDVAVELRVGGTVDLAHPARADRGGDPVVREGPSDQDPRSCGSAGRRLLWGMRGVDSIFREAPCDPPGRERSEC